MTDVVFIPFGNRVVALDRDAFEAALTRGDDLATPPPATSGPSEQRLLTAEVGAGGP